MREVKQQAESNKSNGENSHWINSVLSVIVWIFIFANIIAAINYCLTGSIDPAKFKNDAAWIGNK